MTCYSIDGVRPIVHPEAFVHPQASLIGDVIVGAGCYIGPFASLRGDFGQIVIGSGSNIQDGCVLHSFPQQICELEDNCHVGHAAVLHGCYLETGAFVGIQALVMDGVRLGAACMVAAQSFVKAGQQVAARTLVAGTPAKPVRTLSDDEMRWFGDGPLQYQKLSRRSLDSLAICDALSEPETNRPKLPVSADSSKPLHEMRNADSKNHLAG